MTSIERLAKYAATDVPSPLPGYIGLSQQSWLPLGAKRDLSPDELADVERGKDKWLRGPFASEGSPLTAKMASPSKRALLAAGAMMLAGGGLGAVIGGQSGNPLVGANIGLAAGGLMGAATSPITYLSEKAKNDSLVDRMRRLPEGGTLRDMEADPVYQARQARAAAAANAALSRGLDSSSDLGLRLARAMARRA